jgi:hypothetical protein
MTITFENDSDVIVYALEKIISYAREQQYLFVANCTWWIAGIIGLDSKLIAYIDNHRSHQPGAPRIEKEIHYRGVSETPRDIAREVSPEKQLTTDIPDPLRRTRKGRINPLPQTKNQLKKARKAKQLQSGKSQRRTLSKSSLSFWET